MSRAVAGLAPAVGAVLLVVVLAASAPRPAGATPVAEAATIDELRAAPDYREVDSLVLRFYVAFFGRQPDVAGAKYWIGTFRSGLALDEVAGYFARSEEFERRYGTIDDAAFVDLVYRHVLGRSPDPDGRRYWLDLLTRGRLTRGGLVRFVAEGVEFGSANDYSPLVDDGRRVVLYAVDVEAATGVDPARSADEIESILGDERGWRDLEPVRFAPVPIDQAEFRLHIAKPATVDAACYPLRTNGYLSCRSGDDVWLNADRWADAVPHWTAGVAEYRAYLVNHETGHFLGRGHRGCPGAGRPAPVMQQQSKGLAGCRPNGWPATTGG